MHEQAGAEQDSVLQILSYYPFTVTSITEQPSKGGRKTWEVETDQGTKILKQAEMRPSRMLFVAGAHLHLQEQGLPITPICKTKSGSLCLGVGETAYVVYDKIEGNELTYYNKEQLKQVMQFAGSFQKASAGYACLEEGRERSRLEKWHKLYRWKLQELEGNKHIAASYPTDPFSQMFLQHVDEMLARGKEALLALDEPGYQEWTLQTMQTGAFCQQDFTLARFTEVNGTPFMKELHSVTYDLPSRDLRVLLNKVMKKMAIWDTDLTIELLRSYETTNPLTEGQYRILWTDIAFPHLFCSIAHKYYLSQKRSWSDERYIWALQNIIAVEGSKAPFLNDFTGVVSQIKG